MKIGLNFLIMDKFFWNKKIKNNFNNAANNYSNYSFIQKYFAKKLIKLISELNLPKGESFELGSGTGYLADLIEKKHKSIHVTRIDFSPNMLLQNKRNSKTILWDLNLGLPSKVNNASLIVSCFCIHWLNNPQKAIKEWFERLRTGGYLVVLFPTNKSFPEWIETCKKSDTEYSGLNFPSPYLFKNLFKETEIFLIEEYVYKETFPNIYKLFKSMINVGAHSTKSKRKKISELKLMQEKWPKNRSENVNLTWNINVLILQK